ncbi:MAG: hypothetical protein RLZZ175_2989 [Bacteroidota bacterium]|jgi:dehydrogenase/reductase SDR family protein 7B
MKNKVVLITGGSSGIGKALAFQFGKEGAKIAITGRNENNLNQVVSQLNAAGISALGIVADAASENDSFKVIEKVISTFGQLDVLINNAGISMRALFNDCDVKVLKEVMDINFYGTVYATKAALPHILKTKGSIIGISSIAGYRGLPGRTGYSASKFAMNGFLEALRTELLYSGVNVLTASPGFTSSNIRNTALNAEGKAQSESPLDEGNIMSAEEVALHIYNATVSRKRTIVLTSQGKLTVFLSKWLPGVLDKLVYNHFAKEKDSPLKK